MDDENPNNQTTPPQSPDDQGVNIPVTGASSSPTPVNEPSAITPPTPGQVVSAGSARPPAVPTVSAPSSPGVPPTSPAIPPAQVVTSSHGGGKKRWLKVFLLIIIIGLLAAGGWLAYQKHYKAKAPAVTQSKDIPLLKIGFYQADYGKLYPDETLSEYNFIVNGQIFEGLVRYEGADKIVPDLASDWSNPDSKTWLFTVKDGVKFHDGHTLTASDVKHSFDTLIASKSDIAQTFANTITSVDAVGSNQVKVTTAAPDPALLNKLTFLYVIDANLPQGAEPSQAGTGPYEIKPGTTPTNTHVQLAAFNDYHGGRPATQAVEFGNGDTTEALLDGVRTHKYNIIGPNLAITDKQIKADGLKPFVVNTANVAYLGFNTVKQGPLQNKQVREAIRYALDPVAIGKADSSHVTPLSQLIPPSIPGYNPAIPPYKQNIEKAKQLLAQAGYPNGFTVKYSTADDPVKAAEIAKQLKQIGITATVDQHSSFDEFIDYFSNGQAELYDVEYSSDTLDGLDIYKTTLLPANYTSPQLTAVLDEANKAVDPSKRLKLLQNAATLINQDIPVVPLSTQYDVYLMDKNYALKQDLPSSLLSVYFYKVRVN